MVTEVLPTFQKKQIISSPLLGMVLFIFTEAMIFASFISSFTIIKSSFTNWPPIGQPRLPVAATAVNSCFLFVSAWFLHQAYRFFLKEQVTEKVKKFFFWSVILAGVFVVLQGAEWVRLIHYGLTMTSSVYGAFFYLIVGAHALHVVGANLVLLFLYGRLIQGRLKVETFAAMRAFWFFVVVLWPVLYGLVYL